MRPGQIRRLNLEAWADLAWRKLLLDNWSSTSAQQFLLLRNPHHHLYIDTSWSWGWGLGIIPVVPGQMDHISELAHNSPAVIAVAILGPRWRGHLIVRHCDNAAVVTQINWLHTRDPPASHMFRCLAFLQALFECRLQATHIASTANIGADQLSCNRAPAFLHIRRVTAHLYSHTGAHATSTHPQPPLPRLDIASHEGDVQWFLVAGVTESTLMVYRAGWHKYQTFSSQFSISPTPIKVEKVTLFIAFLGNQSLAISTIKSYIAALKF